MEYFLRPTHSLTVTDMFMFLTYFCAVVRQLRLTRFDTKQLPTKPARIWFCQKLYARCEVPRGLNYADLMSLQGLVWAVKFRPETEVSVNLNQVLGKVDKLIGLKNKPELISSWDIYRKNRFSLAIP